MRTRLLGKSDMDITVLGMGAWAIGGGGWAYAWGSQDDKESIETIHRALDAGLNWIDTAAIYGLGHSEQIVGRAIKGRRRPYVFTKCAMVWDDKKDISFCLKRDSLRRELEASLRRLDLDCIDLYQIHWPNPDPDIEEAWETLAEFKKQGKVRYIGVSNFSVPQMERAARIAPVTSLQPPYSLLQRSTEPEILPYAREHGIGVIVYSPMRCGLLSGKMSSQRVAAFGDDDWRRKDPDFQEPKLTRNLKLVELLREIGRAHGRGPAEVALAWVLRNPAVTAAIVGLRRPDQVAAVIGGAELTLSDEQTKAIEGFQG